MLKAGNSKNKGSVWCGMRVWVVEHSASESSLPVVSIQILQFCLATSHTTCHVGFCRLPSFGLKPYHTVGKDCGRMCLVTRQWSWCLPDSLLRVRFWQVWQCTWCKGRQVAPGAFCIAIPHFKPEMAYSKSHPLLYQTQLSTLSRWISLCGQLGHCVVSSTGFPFVVGGQNIFLPAASRNVHATQEGFILPPLNGMAAIQQAWEHV